MNLINLIKTGINYLSIVVIFLAIFFPDTKNFLWDLSLYSVFILMIIRPLSNIFPSLSLYKLMPLRKPLGIFSSIIVVIFGLIHYFNLGFNGFITEYFSFAYWSFTNNIFWAHLGELTGFILLITSNIFSVKLLKRNWKRIQNLSYVYFFSGSWYVFTSFDKTFGIITIIIVFELTFIAYIKKRLKVDEESGEIYWQW